MRQLWLACTLSVATIGCTVVPDVGDFAGSNFDRVIAKTRCEARDGVRNYVLGALAKASFRTSSGEEIHPYRDLADKLYNGELEWRDLRGLFKRYNVAPDLIDVLNRYSGAVIGYDFEFDITEKNDHSADLDVLRVFSNGSLKLSPSGGLSLQRESVSQSRNIDTFERLATLVGEDYCGPLATAVTNPYDREHKNILYPITGEIGIANLIGSFLNENQEGNLTGSSEASDPDVPTRTWRLTFTTTLSAGAEASLTINARPVGSRLTKGGLTTANSRTDIHKLYMVVKLPKSAPPLTIAEKRLGATTGPISRRAEIELKQAVSDELDRARAKELLDATIKYRNAQTNSLTP